ncbi:response regulator transcription factor [Amycolatopsis sp. NPDC004169]|uniref:response regulator transcription factor n=1 Tax=Amycolatopsis sp. NPDC004169 TaxID=3154453 RepID=UPI0033BBFA03
MSAAPIRIAIAEDMTVLREALVALLSLEDDLEVVAESSRGDDALAKIAALRPDIVLLDLDLPVVDGLVIAERLQGLGDVTKIVVLTALDKPAVVRTALINNVRAFLPKGVSINTLVDAVRTVHRGGTVIGADLISAALCSRPNPLTDRERDVLTLMAAGDTAKEASRKLHIAVGTVSNTMSRILQKLRARNKVDAIRIATENNWI